MYPDPQRLPEGSKTRPVRGDRIMHAGLRRCHLVRDDLNLRLQECETCFTAGVKTEVISTHIEVALCITLSKLSHLGCTFAYLCKGSGLELERKHSFYCSDPNGIQIAVQKLG